MNYFFCQSMEKTSVLSAFFFFVFVWNKEFTLQLIMFVSIQVKIKKFKAYKKFVGISLQICKKDLQTCIKI